MENGIKEYFQELGNNPINPLEIKSSDESIQFIGLTKREYFAGLAMQSLIVSNSKWLTEHVAKFSIKMADALLAELEKPKSK